MLKLVAERERQSAQSHTSTPATSGAAGPAGKKAVKLAQARTPGLGQLAASPKPLLATRHTLSGCPPRPFEAGFDRRPHGDSPGEPRDRHGASPASSGPRRSGGGGPGYQSGLESPCDGGSRRRLAGPERTQLPPPPSSGPPVLDGAELAAWFASTGHRANITVPMPNWPPDYQAAGQQTGVRDDLAFAQSLIETGYFSFPSYGQLTPKDNNFAGIGACDSCAHGWNFPNAQTGVGAQMELLEAYASPKPVAHATDRPGRRRWLLPYLDGPGRDLGLQPLYGISILTVYNQMLTWLIPQRLVAAGILPPARPAGAPPASASPAASTPVSPTNRAPTAAASSPPAPPAADSGSRPTSTSVIAAHYR